MIGSKAISSRARPLIVAVAIAFSVPAALAQGPASNGDDLKVTMRTMSKDGTSSHSFFAIAVSMGVGAP